MSRLIQHRKKQNNKKIIFLILLFGVIVLLIFSIGFDSLINTALFFTNTSQPDNDDVSSKQKDAFYGSIELDTPNIATTAATAPCSLTSTTCVNACLNNDNGISLSKLKEGIITHFEVANLYAKLIGLNSDDVAKINEFEMQERLSLQGVCYLISSKLWALDEAKWILFNTTRPEGVLFGRDVPEDRLKFEESLSFGRAAIAISKLRNKLENNIEQEGDSTVQIENQLFHIVPNQFAELDWSITTPKVQINKGEEITVLSRPRRFFPLVNQLVEDDVKPLLLTSKQANKKFLLYSEDFIKVDKFKELTLEVKKRTNIEILVLPFTTNEIDDEVNTRMRRAKVIRT